LGAVGGFLILLLAVIGIWLLRRRRGRLSLSYSGGAASVSPSQEYLRATATTALTELAESPLTVALDDLPFATRTLGSTSQTTDLFRNDANESVLGYLD
jgi:hypothetical protein